MAGAGAEVIDLSALAADDGGVIDVDALSDSELAPPPARRRRKRRQQQHQAYGANAVVFVDDADVQIVGDAQPLQRRRRRAPRGAAQQPAAAVFDQAAQLRDAAEPAEPDPLRQAVPQPPQPQQVADPVLPQPSPQRRRRRQRSKRQPPQQPAELDPLQQAERQQAEQQAAWEAAVAAAGRVSSSAGICVICMEDGLPPQSMYRLACSHEYCRGCLRQHVMTAVDEQKLIPRCPQPDCKAEIEAEALRGLLSRREWNAVLDVAAEAALPADQKLYCPYPACSALMVKGHKFGEKGITACPHCKGKLCGECGKQPHPDADCAAAAAGADKASGAGVLKLAKKNKWQQCPKCRTLVERLEGCNYMRCMFRGCGTYFCYQCGKQYTSTDHFSCCNPTTGPYALPPGYRHRR